MGEDRLDPGILAAKRNLSVRGMGVVFLVNGLVLGLFWAMCYRALGGTLSARPETLPGLALSGYSILTFAAVAYILVMDMETYFKDGQDAVRSVTLDWLAWCLGPLTAYVLLSALALHAGLPEPRQVVAVESLLTGALMLYGFFLTRRHLPVAGPG